MLENKIENIGNKKNNQVFWGILSGFIVMAVVISFTIYFTLADRSNNNQDLQNIQQNNSVNQIGSQPKNQSIQILSKLEGVEEKENGDILLKLCPDNTEYCPNQGLILAKDASKFKNINSFIGKTINISSDKANSIKNENSLPVMQIVIADPSQIKIVE